LHLECSKYFSLFWKKEKRFLENKRTFNKVKFQILNYSQLLDNNLKFHIYVYVLKYKRVVKNERRKIAVNLSKSSKRKF
jgi:hypothetical protein